MNHAAHDAVDTHGDFGAVVSLFKYGKECHRTLAIGVLLVSASSLFLMLSAKNMGQLAEALLSSAPHDIIRVLIFKILAFESLNIFVTYQGRLKLAFATNQVAFAIRQALFRKLTKLPIRYFDQHPLGRTITRLTSDVEGVEAFFSNTLSRVLTAMITVIFVLVAMLLTDFKVGFWIVLSSLPALCFTVIMRKPARHWIREYKRKSAALNAILAEYINGLSIIKIFGLEQWSAHSFQKNSRGLLKAAYMMMNWNSFIRPLSALLCAAPIVVILWWGGHLTLDNQLSVGLFVAFIRYAERYFRPIMQLSLELHLIQDAVASSERVRIMLDEKEEEDILGPSGELNKKIQGRVCYQKVWMAYDTETNVLKGISFTAEPGQSIGLVGRTGSGKSSALHLLPQLYPIKHGEILIDDVPLSRWDRQHVRSNLGVVSQDVVIFYGTVRENLLISIGSNRHVTDPEIQLACEKTGLWSVLSRMPNGLSTVLNDGGTNLSMGERQLVALTRMLIKDPVLFILDEATANVDEPCEALIQKAIFELLKNRTCFIIAHRLSTIRHCDKILVFDHGSIIEEGHHDELMSQGGHYSKLVERQLANAYL